MRKGYSLESSALRDAMESVSPVAVHQNICHANAARTVRPGRLHARTVVRTFITRSQAAGAHAPEVRMRDNDACN